MKYWLISAVVLAALNGCRDKPDTLITGGYNKQEMEQAIKTARSKVDTFIQELKKPTGVNHAVKAAIKDDADVEHFWLTDVTYGNGVFKGTINNEPGMVNNVEIGQKWTVRKDEISDWMYIKAGKMHGNYTMRPLLKTMSDEEAAKYRRMLAEP